MARWRLRRRHVVLGALLVLGALGQLLGVLAAQRAGAEHLAAGGNPLEATVHAYGVALQATWWWIGGVVALHAAVIATAWWRSDREAWIGGVGSALLHLGWMVLQGILAPATA